MNFMMLIDDLYFCSKKTLQLIMARDSLDRKINTQDSGTMTMKR